MIYNVHVSLHSDFIKICGNEIEVGVMSKPMQGQANLEVIEKIAKYFEISKSNVTIVKGHKSRDKVIRILE